MSIPPPSPSNPVSDREDDPDDDEGGPEIEDSEILADLPDDTDVRRSPSYQRKHVIAHPSIDAVCWVARRSTSCIRD